MLPELLKGKKEQFEKLLELYNSTNPKQLLELEYKLGLSSYIAILVDNELNEDLYYTIRFLFFGNMISLIPYSEPTTDFDKALNIAIMLSKLLKDKKIKVVKHSLESESICKKYGIEVGYSHIKDLEITDELLSHTHYKNITMKSERASFM